MTTIKEILKRHEDAKLSPELIEMIDALLEWGTRPPEHRPVHSPARVISTNPFETRRNVPQKADSPIIPEADLQVAVLELAAQTFRLKSSSSREERNRVSEKTTELSKQIITSAEGRIGSLKTEQESLRSITDSVLRLESELEILRETKSDREAEKEQKLHERDTLKSDEKSLNTEIQTLDREIVELKKKVEDIDEKKVEIAMLLEKEKTAVQDRQKMEKEFETAKIESQKAQTEKENLEKRLNKEKRVMEETHRLVEKLNQHALLQPEITASIRNIWQSLPQDEIDKNIAAHS